MRNLKEVILQGNITALESLLGDIDDNLAKTDMYVDAYKEIEKDWKKFLKTRRFAHYVGDKWCIKLKSPELCKYFISGHDLEKYENDLSHIILAFNTSDYIFPSEHSYFSINIFTNLNLIIGCRIQFSKEDVDKLSKYNTTESIKILDICKVLMDIFLSKKEFSRLIDAKKEFDKNIIYKRS